MLKNVQGINPNVCIFKQFNSRWCQEIFIRKQYGNAKMFIWWKILFKQQGFLNGEMQYAPRHFCLYEICSGSEFTGVKGWLNNTHSGNIGIGTNPKILQTPLQEGWATQLIFLKNKGDYRFKVTEQSIKG